MIIAYYEWNSLKILVTGVGLVGRNLVEFLQKKNQILVYDNLSSSSETDVVTLVDKGTKFLQEDVLDVDTLCEFSKDVDVMSQRAAKSDVKESVINPEITNKVNVDGTASVLPCCIKNN